MLVRGRVKCTPRYRFAYFETKVFDGSAIAAILAATSVLPTGIELEFSVDIVVRITLFLSKKSAKESNKFQALGLNMQDNHKHSASKLQHHSM